MNARTETDRRCPGWTILIYVAADNPLSHNVPGWLTAINKVKLQNDVKVLVEATTTKPHTIRYQVGDGALKTISKEPRVDTSDAAPLRAAIGWAKRRAEDAKLGLVLMTHGSGAARIEHAPHAFDGLGWSSSAKKALTVPQLREAVTGLGLDMIGFDVCMMGMLEVVYELRGAAPLIVAAEDETTNPGWPYVTWLSSVRPDADAEDICGQISMDYIAQDKRFRIIATVSTTEVAALASAVYELADVLRPLLAEDAPYQAIDEARSTAFSPARADFVDLKALVLGLERLRDPRVTAACAKILEALSRAVVGLKGSELNQVGGLTIVFPAPPVTKGDSTLTPGYETLMFAKDGSWLRFVHAFIERAPANR